MEKRNLQTLPQTKTDKMSAIQVGDLVMVVHGCCPTLKTLGLIERVDSIRHMNIWHECGYRESVIGAHLGNAGDPFSKCFPLSWLRKIEPLTVLESTEHKESLPV